MGIRKNFLNKSIKERFNKYLFEVIVIFLGITVSFLFEAWRQGREDSRQVRKELVLLGNDLSRTTDWITQIDSQYVELITLIADFKNGTPLNEEDLTFIFWGLDFYPINFPVRELSPYLNHISELSLTDEITNSQRIISLISYIKTLSMVDYEENQTIVNYSTDKLWPKLNEHNLYDRLLDHEKDFSDSSIHWSPNTYTIDMLPPIRQDLVFIEIKLRRVLTVHKALKNNINQLSDELKKI